MLKYGWRILVEGHHFGIYLDREVRSYQGFVIVYRSQLPLDVDLLGFSGSDFLSRYSSNSTLMSPMPSDS